MPLTHSTRRIRWHCQRTLPHICISVRTVAAIASRKYGATAERENPHINAAAPGGSRRGKPLGRPRVPLPPCTDRQLCDRRRNLRRIFLCLATTGGHPAAYGRISERARPLCKAGQPCRAWRSNDRHRWYAEGQDLKLPVVVISSRVDLTVPWCVRVQGHGCAMPRYSLAATCASHPARNLRPRVTQPGASKSAP